MTNEIKLFKNGRDHDLGVAIHNVGTGGVLRSSSQEVRDYVGLHYGMRAGHIPDAAKIGVIVQQPTQEVVEQADYLSGLFGKRVHVLDEAELARHSSPLVVPYINTPETSRRIEEKAIVWGLPSPIVDRLKNKAESTDLAKQLGIDLPDFKICETEEILEAGIFLVKQTKAAYEQAGLISDYPVGVIIRAAESDGGYGNAELFENGKSITVICNGEAKDAVDFSKWNEALEYAKGAIVASVDSSTLDKRVVLSRRIDIEASPGLSIFIKDGEYYSLGWNSNVQQSDHGKASVGTTTFKPNSEYARRVQEIHEEKTARQLATLVWETAKATTTQGNEITGFVNLDMLIPGALERRYLQLKGRGSDLVYFCEVNPRLTNWTDALLLTLWVTQGKQTFEAMYSAAKRGVLTLDKVPVRSKNPQILRDRVLAADQELAEQYDSRLILRMPKTPTAGVVIIGNTAQGLVYAKNL